MHIGGLLYSVVEQIQLIGDPRSEQIQLVQAEINKGQSSIGSDHRGWNSALTDRHHISGLVLTLGSIIYHHDAAKTVRGQRSSCVTLGIIPRTINSIN